MSLRYVLAVSLAAALLSGCATPQPPYAPAEGTPTANLKSNINAPSSRSESIDIGVVEENKRMPTRLFAIDKWISKPAGYQKVLAGEPLILTYFENSSGAPICRVTIQVVLEAGKSYTLVGGETYTPNPIPLLRGTRGCKFGVMDDETSKPVPAQPAKTNLPWFAQ